MPYYDPVTDKETESDTNSASTSEISNNPDSVESTFLCIYELSIMMNASTTMTNPKSEDSLKKFTELEEF